jgi:hypothetical protein
VPRIDRASLGEQAEAMFRGSQRAAIDVSDKKDIDLQYSKVMKSIAKPTGGEE